MKKLVCGTAVAMTLAFASPGPIEAQSPPPIQPGAPPAQTQAAPTPYVVPQTTPPPVVKKKTVRRRTRVRARSSSDNIANQLNAQELTGAGHGPAIGPHGAFGGPMRPMPVSGPGFPPPFYRPPPPPFWYPPPPRPWGPWWRPWGPWWRPWRPYGWW